LFENVTAAGLAYGRRTIAASNQGIDAEIAEDAGIAEPEKQLRFAQSA
jgi:hypothetical protein